MAAVGRGCRKRERERDRDAIAVLKILLRPPALKINPRDVTSASERASATRGREDEVARARNRGVRERADSRWWSFKDSCE